MAAAGALDAAPRGAPSPRPPSAVGAGGGGGSCGGSCCSSSSGCCVALPAGGRGGRPSVLSRILRRAAGAPPPPHSILCEGSQAAAAPATPAPRRRWARRAASADGLPALADGEQQGAGLPPVEQWHAEAGDATCAAAVAAPGGAGKQKGAQRSAAPAAEQQAGGSGACTPMMQLSAAWAELQQRVAHGQQAPAAAAKWPRGGQQDTTSFTSCGSASSSASSSSPFRPRPPAGGSSPQRARPGVLRHSLSALSVGSLCAPAGLAGGALAAGPRASSPAAAKQPPGAPAAPATPPQLREPPPPAAAAPPPPQRAAAAPGAAAQQLVTPIAVARHCPPDIDARNWQPSLFARARVVYEGRVALVAAGAHAPSGRPLALKVYTRAALGVMERFQLAREVSLHMRARHPAIAELYGAYKDGGHVYLLMELAPSGNLYQMLMSLPAVPAGTPRRLDEAAAAARVIRPLVGALAYLHSQGIIHRDIKLENVLLGRCGGVKLADFGLAIDAAAEPANTRLGTAGYFAPEVLALPLKASPFEGKSPAEAAARPGYDAKVDVWSAGVVCFELLTGRAPFAADTAAGVLQAILHRTLVYPGHLSPAAVDFLSAALTRDPAARPTAAQLLAHPFLADGGAPAAARR
ncbi:hypothetical protein HT031_002687 [Scenedesmus sp. PABB004]|nr:hypothetical protein HT031_002687 [Scenedesmus sp. PABB004]